VSRKEYFKKALHILESDEDRVNGWRNSLWSTAGRTKRGGQPLAMKRWRWRR